MVVTTEKREAVEAFAQQVEVVEGRSLWKDARRRFLRNKAALTSLIILTIIGLAVIVGPHLSQYTFDDPDWGAMQAAPDMETGHWFGTDSLGRDLFVRTLLGGRISLMVGIMGAVVAVIIGTLYGAASGFIGGRVDSLMSGYWRSSTPSPSCSSSSCW